MTDDEADTLIAAGVEEIIDVDEWWCESEQRWVECPGPCPDGTPHSQQRQRQTTAVQMPTMTAEQACAVIFRLFKRRHTS